jgi:anti-sigma factor RsiW
MMHRRARRLLTGLLDGGLSPPVRRAVDAHVAACPECRRRLQEHRTVAALVRMLPAALLPVEPSASAQRRLWGLARWFVDPVAAARERLGISAVGLGVAVLAMALSITVSSWAPMGMDTGSVALGLPLSPDIGWMLPLGWR